MEFTFLPKGQTAPSAPQEKPRQEQKAPQQVNRPTTRTSRTSPTPTHSHSRVIPTTWAAVTDSTTFTARTEEVQDKYISRSSAASKGTSMTRTRAKWEDSLLMLGIFTECLNQAQTR